MLDVVQDEGTQTLEWVNEVRFDLQLPILAELPLPTGPLASQTRVGLAIECSVYRLREPNTHPVALLHDETTLGILIGRGARPTPFNNYPSFPGGPIIYELFIPTFTWSFVYGIPAGERVVCQPMPEAAVA